MNKIFVNVYKALRKLKFLDYLSDRDYLRFSYRILTGKKLDLDNPKTFGEKLQWLKLHDRDPRYIKLVDKYAVKKYVADIIGEEYIIGNLGVWNSFDDIDFNALPNQFVLKCTHDSGGLVICWDKNKFDFKVAKSRIEKALKKNYYFRGREWPYKNVPKKIIAEKYMSDFEGNDLRDYKFYCFSGKPVYCQVISNRFTKETIDFYDMNWKPQPFNGYAIPNKPKSDSVIKPPRRFDEMIKIAETLSYDMAFLRVDLYEIRGKIYFGELTLYPASGFGSFYPEKWNGVFGKLVDLSRISSIRKKK